MTKKNLLLLHGALGSENQMTPLSAALADQFKVYSFSFEGHGGRPSDQPFSIDLFTENVLTFLQENKIEQTHIFGYSMGGYVGLNLAQLYPDKVHTIVSLGTKFNWSAAAAEKETKMLNPIVIEEKVPKFAKSLEKAHYPNDWKKLLQKTAYMMMELGAGKKLKDTDLNTIRHPALICVGSLDKMVSVEESQQAVNQLANARLKIIEDFLHPIEKNNVAQLATIISDFITKE